LYRTPERCLSRSSKLARWLAAAAIGCSGLALMGLVEARSDPVVRTLTLRMGGGPAQPVRILLMSDIHSQPSDMSPGRLRRIVRAANALRPDLVVLAGDFLGNDGLGTPYPIGEGLAPLGGLRARYGIFAVLGNNDRPRRSLVERELRSLGVSLLEDDAVRAGPVSIGGVERRFKHTGRELLTLPAPRILVAHSPQKFPDLPSGVSLMLSGHTHCGQISLPFLGPVLTGGKIPRAYACGFAKLKGRALVVTGGLGTSTVPLRFAAPPDMWLISITAVR
jgi:predicted MPP superfamily phosphohydrolase